MSQIKIYAKYHSKTSNDLSNAIHQALVMTFQYPEDKRFHRFIALAQKTLFILWTEVTYTIRDFNVFRTAGRNQKRLIQQIFSNIQAQCGSVHKILKLQSLKPKRKLGNSWTKCR
jgi:hypothetical protein